MEINENDANPEVIRPDTYYFQVSEPPTDGNDRNNPLNLSHFNVGSTCGDDKAEMLELLNLLFRQRFMRMRYQPELFRPVPQDPALQPKPLIYQPGLVNKSAFFDMTFDPILGFKEMNLPGELYLLFGQTCKAKYTQSRTLNLASMLPNYSPLFGLLIGEYK